MHWTGHTSTQARSFTSMHASVMIARPATAAPRLRRMEANLDARWPGSGATSEPGWRAAGLTPPAVPTRRPWGRADICGDRLSRPGHSVVASRDGDERTLRTTG